MLGGWVCNSPLQEEARAEYTEAVTIAEALLTDNFYVVAEMICDITFVEEFYNSKGMKVKVEIQDTIGEGENPFVVYKVSEQKGTTIKIGKR